MPVLPKFIVTKFTIKSEVVGVYDTLENAEVTRKLCKRQAENGISYKIFEVVKDATVNST